MSTKSYSKHKEYKEFSSSGTIPYTDEQFDMLKSELIPKGSKLDSLGRNGGAREYHYEYKEEKHPSGKYDRKDMHTVEEYTIPPRTVPKTAETSSYYYEREERELPAITSGTRTYNYETSSSTPGYSKVKSSKVSKDLTQNVEELDSLLDDLQKDQERQLYKSKNHDGYTSDTAESTSFDYRRGTPAKAPSSGYSTLKREERLESSSWGSSPPPTITRAAEVRQELFREEKTEVRPVPVQTLPVPQLSPPAPCTHCHHAPSTGTLSRSGTPMNKVTTTVKTYTYEVPADQDPTTVPLPTVADHHHSYVTSEQNRITTSGSSPVPVAPPPGGCQYCSHCNSSTREYRTLTTTDVSERNNERMVFPSPANEVKLLPSDPHHGHAPYSPTSYKYSETSYSSQNSTQRFPGSPSPQPPHTGPAHSGPLLQAGPSPSPGPFPRPTTPSPGTQQPPKKLDDLLADFPEARFPTQPDGVVRRNVHVTHESSRQGSGRDTLDTRDSAPSSKPAPAASRNVPGPAVYYPPGHTPFQKKEGGGYQASSAMQQGGGSYAAGRGMYEYESGSRSKEMHSEKKTAVPICLPLCCAMPCVIM